MSDRTRARVNPPGETTSCGRLPASYRGTIATALRWLMVMTSLGALGSGCSSQAVRVGSRPPVSYEVVGPGRGGACGLLLEGIIPIRLNSRVERAYGDAIRGKGTALINTQLQYSWWYIPYVGTLHCTIGNLVTIAPQLPEHTLPGGMVYSRFNETLEPCYAGCA